MIAQRRNALRLPRHFGTVLLLTASLMLESAGVRPQDAAPGKVTLEGQLV